MNIGFDAKRAYHNTTGLGVYSRVLIDLLTTHYPQHSYYLFNPRPGSLYSNSAAQVHEVLPQHFFHKLLKSAWRSKWVVQDIKKWKIHLYHGLSHEIPIGLPQAGVSSIVTMHDLFPEIYPENYKPLDVKIYRSKSRYACKNADRIISTSQETQKHLIDIYNLPPEKITVVYQSCDPSFSVVQTDEVKERIREKYHLPKAFFLHVGTIIERKNLLAICKALQQIRGEINIPLVVVGRGGAYKQVVQQYIREQQLEQQVIFLSDRLEAQGAKPFIDTKDFPAIYQLATAFIYPSFYEGFGIPVAEALSSGVPVITASTSCLPEVGGPASYYVDPHRPEEIAAGMKKIYGDAQYVTDMKTAGLQHAKLFSPQVYVKNVMDVYEKIR